MASGLQVQLEMLATIWAVRDEVCAGVLRSQAGPIAAYWAQRAADSPAIARALEGMSSGGGWLAALAVHGPLIMVVMQHHVTPYIERVREQRSVESEGSPWPAPPEPEPETPEPRIMGYVDREENPEPWRIP